MPTPRPAAPSSTGWSAPRSASAASRSAFRSSILPSDCRRRSRPSRVRCSTTSGSPGTRRSTLKWSRASTDDPVRVRTPLQTIRRVGADQPVRVRHRAAGLSVPPGSPGGQGALDVQPRTGVLAAGPTRPAAGSTGCGERFAALSAFPARSITFPLRDSPPTSHRPWLCCSPRPAAARARLGPGPPARQSARPAAIVRCSGCR